MLLGLDHLVVAVADPDAAAAELKRRVGLACTGGGRHPAWGTFNRLAFLGDTYVELIGLFDRSLAPNGAVSKAVLEAVDGGTTGLVSFALASDDLLVDAARLRAAGSTLGPLEARSRTRPDGEVVRWQAAYGPLGPAEPPFIIEHEYTGAEWGDAARSARASFIHPIGSRARIAGLELPVADPALTAAAYHRTTGLAFDADLRASVGGQWIRLVRGEPLRSPAVIEIALLDAADAPPATVDALGLRWRFRRDELTA
jgi:hypothetical protein